VLTALSRAANRARAKHGAERGFFMVWFALLFTTLLGFAGLAMEYNRWQSLGVRVQKAADAAALAGAVFLPDNLGKAQTTAKSTASMNGFTHNTSGVTITATKARLPNQLKVTISVPTKNPWGAIVGYGNTTIVRTAVAEYQLPQNLGSPENRYGNDPEKVLVTGETQPQFWGNVFGPSSSKAKGDAFQAKLCDLAASNAKDWDNCLHGGQNNLDYDANGYFYGIEVPDNTVGSLKVDVFDPAFVHVHDNCGSYSTPTVDDPKTDQKAVEASLNAAKTLTAAAIPGYPAGDPPSIRYAPGSDNKYCTGDMYYGEGPNSTPTWTRWTVRAPDTSNWDPSNNPIVCQAEFPGVYPERANDLPGGTVDANRLRTLLQQTTNYPGVQPAMRFADFFRRWVNLCTISSPDAGTYYLQVQTNLKINGSAAPMAGGANRYSVRVGIGSDYSTANNLRLYGNGRMGIYANATGADTRFFLTRILPGEAGKTLVLQFFDTGDASAAGKIQVLPPPDSNVAGGVFTNCRYTKPPGNQNNQNGATWGPLIATSTPQCQITDVTNTGTNSFDGQWVTYEVPIPSNYTCNDQIATGCWTRLRFSYDVGTSVQDTTSWVAYVLGEPVRLIQ